jgi:hypothetical protein
MRRDPSCIADKDHEAGKEVVNHVGQQEVGVKVWEWEGSLIPVQLRTN